MTIGEPSAIGLRPLLAGSASGAVLILDEGLSFWGGFDPHSGLIIDALHPAVGVSLTGVIAVMPSGRGSSSSSSVLAEAIRLGTAPAAILLEEADEILVLGALVAQLLYGTTCPMAEIPVGHGLATGDRVRLTDAHVLQVTS